MSERGEEIINEYEWPTEIRACTDSHNLAYIGPHKESKHLLG